MATDPPADYKPWSFDWHQENRKGDYGSFLGWMIPTLIAYGHLGESAHDLGDRIGDASDGFKDVRITMQVNGIEVDPAHFVEGVESNMRWTAQKRAQELVQETMNDLFDPISELAEDFRRKIKLLVAEKTGYELHEDDRY